MKSFSSKRLLLTGGVYFALFLAAILLGIFLTLIKDASWLMGAVIGASIGAIFFLMPSIYYLVCRYANNKKAQTMTPITGPVSNWELGFFRHSASISVVFEDKEYSSPSFFGQEEARELVGKEISYCIINDAVYIFKIV